MKIIYLAQCIKEPSGGTKVAYQHVDILNELGHEAAIWHPDSGFRYDKFENSTKIVYGSEFIPDLVVSPPVNFVLGGPGKKVIFDQNAYYMGPEPKDNIEAFMVVSEDNKQYLEFLYPESKIFVIPNYIDPEAFPLCKEKQPIICMDGRKNWEDMEQVVRIIKPICDAWKWEMVTFLDNTEEQTSEIMQRAAIYLQFGLREGLCLMPMEAMSCGCRVIGYHGQGGKEYVNPDVWDTVETGNIIEFAKTILARMNDGTDGFDGHAFIHGKYSREKTKEALREFYEHCGNR